MDEGGFMRLGSNRLCNRIHERILYSPRQFATFGNLQLVGR